MRKKEKGHKLRTSEMKEEHHYRSHEHKKDDRGMIRTLCPQFDNLDESDQFLERYFLPTQQEVANLNRSVSSKEI